MINMVSANQYAYRNLMAFTCRARPCHLAARPTDRYKPPKSADPAGFFTKDGSHGARAHVLNH
jgi:hypothetical protein